MKLLTLSLTSALVLCAPLYAHAAVDEAGAAALAQQINAALKDIGGMTANGDVTVKVSGDGFDVALPGLSDTRPNSNNKFTILPVTAHMVPVSETNYKYTATLPSPFLTITGSDGQPKASATVGQQQISGEWDSKNHFYPSAVAVLKDTAITDAKGEFTFRIAELGLVSQTTMVSEDHADGQASLNMRGLNLVFTDSSSGNSGQMKINAVGITSEIRNYDVASINRIREEARALQGSAKPSATQAMSFFGSLFGAATPQQTAGSSGSKFSFVLNNLDLTIGKVEGATPTHIVLPLLKFNGTASSTDDNLVDLGIQYEHAGLNAAPLPSAVIGDVLPAGIKLDLALNHLPVADLFKQAADAVATAMASKPAADGSAPATAPAPTAIDHYHAALALMEKSQTALNVNQISYTAKAINSNTQGVIKVAQASPIGAIGNIDTRLNGVQELVAKLSQAMQSQQAQPDPMVQNVMMALSTVQMFGQQVPNAAPSGLMYKLELTPEGAIKMNGNDLSAMAGAMGGGNRRRVPAHAEEGEIQP